MNSRDPLAQLVYAWLQGRGYHPSWASGWNRDEIDAGHAGLFSLWVDGWWIHIWHARWIIPARKFDLRDPGVWDKLEEILGSDT